MSIAGTHRGRAREWALGHASNGNEQIAVLFELTQGEHAGKTITWFGSFSDAAVDRTLDSLRHCGWDGDNFAALDGLDANEVELVIQPETYEGKTRDRVRWVNRPSRLALREQMGPGAASAFAAKMRAKALAHKQSYEQNTPRPSTPRAQPGEQTTRAQFDSRASQAPQAGVWDRRAGAFGLGAVAMVDAILGDQPPPSDDDIPF